jgi:hypothetical protein
MLGCLILIALGIGMVKLSKPIAAKQVKLFPQESAKDLEPVFAFGTTITGVAFAGLGLLVLILNVIQPR